MHSSNRAKPTGAILCGGASLRMGRPKHALALNDGRTMIEHVLAALSPVCEQVVLVGTNAAAVDPSLRGIVDTRPGLGPLAGIEALLASKLSDEYLVSPCDVPRITSQVFEALLAGGAAPTTVLRVRGQNEALPLPTRISSLALYAVRELLDSDCRAVHRLHRRLSAHVVEVPEAWDVLLTNVNTPEDVDLLNRR